MLPSYPSWGIPFLQKLLSAKQAASCQIKDRTLSEIGISDHKNFEYKCTPKYCMGPLYTKKKLLIVHLKFKFYWESCIFICEIWLHYLTSTLRSGVGML